MTDTLCILSLAYDLTHGSVAALGNNKINNDTHHHNKKKILID